MEQLLLTALWRCGNNPPEKDFAFILDAAPTAQFRDESDQKYKIEDIKHVQMKIGQ